MSRPLSRRPWQVYAIIHRDVGQRSDHLQSGPTGLTAQSTMEAELVVAALAMKKAAVFCSIMMLELGFDESFGSVSLYIDNTLALYVAGKHCTYSPRANHIALRYSCTYSPRAK